VRLGAGALLLACVGVLLIAIGVVMLLSREHGAVASLEAAPGYGLIVLGTLLVVMAANHSRTRARFRGLGWTVDIAEEPPEPTGDADQVELPPPAAQPTLPPSTTRSAAVRRVLERRQRRP